MDFWQIFHGPNAGYVLELYERYLRDPDSVDAAAQAFFAQAPPELFAQDGARVTAQPAATGLPAAEELPARFSPEKAAGVTNLAQAIRWYGHFAARLDPLGSLPPDDPALHLETHGLSEDDLRRLPGALIGGAAVAGGSALEAIQYLREIYSGAVGHDYLQIRNPDERQWLREAAESRRFSVEHDPIDPVALLERLTRVEVFEHFLQRSFVAKTRFSIEGLDMLVPLLDTVTGMAAESGIYNSLLGMAHRGRLNVLAHVLNKPYHQILAEFKDPLNRRVVNNEAGGWAGDVKYHAGASRTLDDDDPDTIDLTISMAPNPSHLESVNPVVEGMARAAGTRAGKPGPSQFDPSITLPVLIHGDAAFPGQGVVSETLNMYRLRGYTTGGTIHVIANNQIGFTTGTEESRSTLFASDLAKGFRIPIIHVNADDPEGVIMAARIAFAYRQRFQRDFLIDLVGYRRLGHNEGDEPAFTQPLLYRKIETHPTVRQIWAGRLVQRRLIAAERPDQLYQQYMDELQQELEKLDPEGSLDVPIPPAPPAGAARNVRTAVPLEQLTRLNRELMRLPVGFTVHPRLARIRQRRERILTGSEPEAQTESPIDWSTAEELALAAILEDGIPIRLTGQDAERGTFSHRHAVLNDANTGERYIPLQRLPLARAAFEIHNSPLSEYAALGFEFGYNVQEPERLVIWEAQYGDFINNAQAVIDEFIATARDKWGQLPSLVMLLPHGYEGQGPDHSSGRLERFLNLFADNNLRVANCTTSANYFHLLRRQAATLAVDPLPLVIMTPKSLLRHPLVASPVRDFTEGGWQPVIDRQPTPGGSGEQPRPLPPVEAVRRLVLCSGKVYVDLVSSPLAGEHPEVGVARVEQLAPFPVAGLRDLLDGYPGLEEVVWMQEEPENMGAWEFARPYLESTLGGRWTLHCLARPRGASPAEGSNNLHTHNQRRLIEQAYARSEKSNKPRPRRNQSKEKPLGSKST